MEEGFLGERMNCCVCVEGGGGYWIGEEGFVGEEVCRGGEEGGEGEAEGEEEMDIASRRRRLLNGVDIGEGGRKLVRWFYAIEDLGLLDLVFRLHQMPRPRYHLSSPS